MINDLIYVYCVAGNPPGFINELESNGLESINFDDFNVIIKYVSDSEFSEENLKRNISDLAWLEFNVREHIRVIGTIMAVTPVIPFKFGTIYNSSEGLKKFLTDYSGSIKENFNNLREKEEWAVKIYCNRKSLIKQIDELSEPAAILEKQIMASSPGKAFLLQRKKAELIENELDRLCKECGQTFFNELNGRSMANNLNNLLPKEVTGREDTMILNAAFLVSNDKVPDFNKVIELFGKNEKNSSFNVDLTGPWPPFSFISIKENKQ